MLYNQPQKVNTKTEYRINRYGYLDQYLNSVIYTKVLPQEWIDDRPLGSQLGPMRNYIKRSVMLDSGEHREKSTSRDSSPLKRAPESPTLIYVQRYERIDRFRAPPS